MTYEGQSRSSSAEVTQSSLNPRQAWDLLDLDMLFLRASRDNVPFGWERFLTGLNCYALLGSTAFLGEQVPIPEYVTSDRNEDARRLLDDPRFSSARYLLSSIPVPASREGSFAQAAAFLDMTSDWITSDDLAVFLSNTEWRELQAKLKQMVRLAQYRTHAPRSIMRLPQHSIFGALRIFLTPAFRKFDGEINGFYRYLDLSVDLMDFKQDGEFANQWIQSCLSFWVERNRARKVLDLVHVCMEEMQYGDPKGVSEMWYRREKAVDQLTDTP